MKKRNERRNLGANLAFNFPIDKMLSHSEVFSIVYNFKEVFRWICNEIGAISRW